MKFVCIILLLLVGGTAWSQADSVRKRIDSLEDGAIALMYLKTDGAIDSMTVLAARALEESRQVGYSHGIAVGLACQGFCLAMHASDFRRAERLSRESLDWFSRTDNKYAITMAYYVLGFSLFAQSHFDEAQQCYEKARIYARRAGNCVEELYMYSLTGEAYREQGDYEKAFDVLQQCIAYSEEFHHREMTRSLYFTLAEMFVHIEDYSSAQLYFREGFGNDEPEQTDPWTLLVYTELLTHQHKYDSALYYFARYDSAHAGPSKLRTFLATKGEYYLCREDYATALPYFQKSLSYQRQMNDRNQVMRCLQDLSKTQLGLGRDAEAFRDVREELTLATATHARQNIRDGYQMLYLLYDREGRMDSAYSYYRRYIVLKDSVLNDQLKGKFASYGFQQQIRLLNQEKQLQDVCLREEMLTKKLLIMGIAVILLLGAIYVWIVRLKRKNEAHRRKRAEDELEIERLEGERAKAALLQRAKELEIQALRSQMNPHFIFNCLNAINRFILGHETEAASDYLTKFSRLMRMIMNHSRHSYISLADELEVLRLYLDMERLRFKDAFDYSINVPDDLDTDEIRIPPLLVQPFVENAVWHGLMQKEQSGSLSITIRVAGDLLTCVIRDDGIGRKRAALLKSKSAEKHKSMGLQITAERMALLTGAGEPKHFFHIDDLYDGQGNPAGTQVTLTIKINQPTGETVGEPA
jgi:tetratricopeptide (TPR) repeat protein